MKYILRHHRMPGDILAMTPLVRAIDKQYPGSIISCITLQGEDIWINNPHIYNNKYVDLSEAKMVDLDYNHVLDYPESQLHHSYGFKIDWEQKTGQKLDIWDCKPEIFLNNSEIEKSREYINKFGRYIVLSAGVKPHCKVKLWPDKYWEELIQKNMEYKFVMVGLAKYYHLLLLNKYYHVIDYIEQTDLRELFSLVYGSVGVLSYNSLLMHIAAAFDKSAIILSGGREPLTYSYYPNQKQFHTRCKFVTDYGCLKSNLRGTEKVCYSVDTILDCPECMAKITPSMVSKAIGNLPLYKSEKIEESKKIMPNMQSKKEFMMVCNTGSWGGGERSAVNIMRIMQKEGYEINLIPLHENIHPEFKKAIDGFSKDNLIKDVVIHNITDSYYDFPPIDILFFQVNDSILRMGSRDFFWKIKAKRKVMGINYKTIGIGEYEWTKGWDLYICQANFLKKEIQAKGIEEEKIKVLPAPTNVTDILNRDYNRDFNKLRLIRHSGQGGNKYPQEINDHIRWIFENRKNIEIHLMPTPPNLYDMRVHFYPYNGFNPLFYLEFGNCFWYYIPEDKFKEICPNSVIEAMASGLPILCNDNGGLIDIVDNEVGWVVKNVDEMIEVIKNVSISEVKEKGGNARRRIIEKHKPEFWLDAIMFEEDCKGCKISIPNLGETPNYREYESKEIL